MSEPLSYPPPADAAVTVTLGLFFTRYLVRLYSEFEGDVVAAIVLGEVAHHNTSEVCSQSKSPEDLAEGLSRLGTPGGPALLPTNAFSIAQATGIPRETVRRKVAWLVERGFMQRDARGNLTIGPQARSHFARFNDTIAMEVLELADTMRRLGASRPQLTGAGR